MKKTAQSRKKAVLLWQIRAVIIFVPIFLLLMIFCGIRLLLLATSALIAVFFSVVFLYIPSYFKNFSVKKSKNLIIIEKGIFFKSRAVLDNGKIISVTRFSSPLQALIKAETVTLRASNSAVRIITAKECCDEK